MKKLSSWLFILLLTPQLARAAYGLEEANGGLPVGKGSTFAERLSSAIGSVVGSLLAFLGVLFLLLIIYGGFLWMTSGGDEKNASKGKGLIQAAVVGLLIILSAYAVTAYLGDSLLNL